MNPISVSEASVHLGVNKSRVRALIDAGELDAVKVGSSWVVDEQSLLRRKEAGRGSGRPFELHNAWALLFEASGHRPYWSSQSELWRLRQLLSFHGLSKLRHRLHRRAEQNLYVVHPGELSYLARGADLIPSGSSAARSHGFDVIGGHEVDAYVPAEAIPRLVDEHALTSAENGNANVRLRAIPAEAWPFGSAGAAPRAAVALDLAESADSRLSRAGLSALREIDREWRRPH